MLRACLAGRHLELLRKNPQGVGIVVALALMIALAPRRPRLATAAATINMAHTFPFLSNHAALWITALAAGTDSAVCRALLGVGYQPPAHKLNADFMHPVIGCMADFGGRFARLADAFGLPTLADAAEASVALVGPPFVALELFGGLAILLRLKVVALLAFAALHAPTALIVFYDFGSVALAVLWPDLLWFSPRALREHWNANIIAAIALLPLTSAAPGSPGFLRAQALRAALLVAAALRLWRRGVWFAASRPRGRRRCGVLGSSPPPCGSPCSARGRTLGSTRREASRCSRPFRFHPDGRTSRFVARGWHLAVPPRRAAEQGRAARLRALQHRPLAHDRDGGRPQALLCITFSPDGRGAAARGRAVLCRAPSSARCIPVVRTFCPRRRSRRAPSTPTSVR